MATQYYQPLSHALEQQTPYSHSAGVYDPTKASKRKEAAEEEEEEEEGESDNEDQDAVEQQLHGSNHSSPRPLTIDPSATTIKPPEKQVAPAPASTPVEVEETAEGKRRPGRPRGSKTRKSRIIPPTTTGTTQKVDVPQTPSPPQLSNVNTSTQQYYEFQWRVLNLCAEFYGAAEELVKATPALVIAQSYQMGPGVVVDPLHLLNEAKRHCDTLLNNPLALIKNPPAPVYPALPPLVYQGYPTSFPPPPQPTNGTNSASAIASTSALSPATVITNPGTFAVPLTSGSGHGAPSAPAGTSAANMHYPVYNTLQYPYYYQPYNQANPYFPPPATTSQSAPVLRPASSTTSTAQPPASVSTSATAPTTVSNSGPWSEDETDRIRQLYEKARVPGVTPEGKEWDWVVKEWGPGRNRNQILAKATSLGIRSTPARGTKRRRESGAGEEQDEANSKSPPTPAAQTTPAAVSNGQAAPPSTLVTSPALSHATMTPGPSPLLPTLQRSNSSLTLSSAANPPASKGKSTNVPNGPILKLSKSNATATSTPPPTLTTMPWPMPTVAAVNNSLPSVPSTTTLVASALSKPPSNHYRPNPAADKDAADASAKQQATVHPYMYQPAGQTSAVRYNGKPNGK